MIAVERRPDRVAVVEFGRAPSNFFDAGLIRAVADAYEKLDEDAAWRAIVLCSSGRHFCAGADFSGKTGIGTGDLYEQAVRLFGFNTPVVAAVQGAAVGGGLGLALSADFRVASPDSDPTPSPLNQRSSTSAARAMVRRVHREAELRDLAQARIAP